MKKVIALFLIISAFAACKQQENGAFTVNGTLKNIVDQKVYLEQLFFNSNNPQVIDTSEIKAGKFSVSGIGSEEGLYRLRFEKSQIGYLFINDKSKINFTADINATSLENPTFNSPANEALKLFLIKIDNLQKDMTAYSASIDSLQKAKASDSIIAATIATLTAKGNTFQQFIIRSIDSIKNPVVAMFALGYTRGIPPDSLKTVVPNLAIRFPKHTGVADIIVAYNKMIAAPPPTATADKPIGKLGIGSMAPEINMLDTSGNAFLLSSLKGKYVLVDFWASWCMPCRGENPNIVANYNKYKNKNFTILGVSLDEDRAAWAKAIVKDKLAFTQISDLKGWACAATATYGFDAIPYNVLLNPSGKIIATELRGEDLGKKLAEVLK